MSIRQLTVNKYNDMYFIGKSDGIGRMVHYNGIRFSEFGNGLRPLVNYGEAHSIDNLCVSVGYVNNKAYITKIKRN
jgi:hypothetical protein